MRKNIYLALLIFVIVTPLVGCSEAQEPSNSTTTNEAQVVMDLSAFIAEFDANTDAANSKYKDKTVTLTGPYIIAIAAKGTNTQPPYMMLAPITGDAYAGTLVQCYTTTSEAEKYYTGQQARLAGVVQGVPTGYSGIVEMNDCRGA